MRPEEIRNHLRREPFCPFRLYFSNGISCDVRHPELMLVGRRDVVIALDVGEDAVPERFACCDPVHVTNIEPLDGGRKPKHRSKRK